MVHKKREKNFPKNREPYPTKEVDPEHFLEDEEVREMVKNINDLELKQKDFYKLYNCVDCAECETEEGRIILKRKFLEQGYTFEGWEEMVENFKKHRTPYPTNEMRIRIPKDIPKDSDTLFFMGCLSTIRIPRYTEHALQYLLAQNIDFTILDEEICCGWPWYVSGSLKELGTAKKENLEIFKNYKKIICLCPACYYLFKTEYVKDLDNDIKIEYITDYLRPALEKKSGIVAFQHLCQLMNRPEGDKVNVDKFVEGLFKKSGYEIAHVPHWCCGGGIGYMHREEIIDKVAKRRMEDFDKEEIDFVTTYCVSCWWILKRFGRMQHIKPKIKDVFELLM
ncbi:MAG: Lactate utilization protein A [Promethearchaeota archaeon]|nr:MAG: Lactate utilization protein A [Candidatus Lokiarchaeota archaeon]